MVRIVGGVLVMLLALPALGDENKAKDEKKATPALPVTAPQDKAKDKAADKPNNQPGTPAQQIEALLKEYQDAREAFSKNYEAAKTDEERQKIIKEKYPQPDTFAPKFLAIAEKNPKDSAAVDALVWVTTNTSGGGKEKDTPRTKALALLLKEHVASGKLGAVCQSLANGFDKQSEALLRAVLDKNPNKDVQGEACLALAQLVGQRATLTKRLKDPDEAKRYTEYLGKETVEELQKMDLAKVEAENVALFRQVAEKYIPEMKADRLTELIQRLSRSTDKGSEFVLRTLLDKDTRKEVQGAACLYLAQLLKSRADAMPEAETKDAEKVRQESEKLFERALDKFADVKAGWRGTVKDHAESELFELRFLSVGKPAPEIEAEDLDKQTFKLSDYRGKVVMIDFWGNW